MDGILGKSLDFWGRFCKCEFNKKKYQAAALWFVHHFTRFWRVFLSWHLKDSLNHPDCSAISALKGSLCQAQGRLVALRFR